MNNRQTIFFLASLFLGLLILGMLYVSNFKNTFEGYTEGNVDSSGISVDSSSNSVLNAMAIPTMSPTTTDY